MKTLRMIVELAALVMMSIIFALVAQLPFLAVLGVFSIIALAPKPAGAALMALDVELWRNWIVDQLFANNNFLNLARNADDMVLKGKIVHIPQSAAAGDVEKNRSSLPAAITKRTDSDVTYTLDEYTTAPKLIPDADKILSYDKMGSVLGQEMGNLKDYVSREMLYNWVKDISADYVIDTTGASVTTHLTGTTGNRKKLTLDNFDEAQARMDENDIPFENRYAMLSARMYKQLRNLFTATDYKDFSSQMDAAKGVIGGYAGFKFMMRSTSGRFVADGGIKSVATANAVTDCDGVICWHKDWVERAMGTITLFEQLKAPTYYGDIYSLLVNAGGRAIEENAKGIIVIRQDIP